MVEVRCAEAAMAVVRAAVAASSAAAVRTAEAEFDEAEARAAVARLWPLPGVMLQALILFQQGQL